MIRLDFFQDGGEEIRIPNDPGSWGCVSGGERIPHQFTPTSAFHSRGEAWDEVRRLNALRSDSGSSYVAMMARLVDRKTHDGERSTNQNDASQTQLRECGHSEYWNRIAEPLGVRVVAPHEVVLSGGQTIVVPVFVPRFGGTRGMLIVSNVETIASHADELGKIGYGISVMSEPAIGSPVDIESLKEVLADWTWCGPKAERPDWLPE